MIPHPPPLRRSSPSNPPATIAQVCNAHAPIYTDFHRFRESSPLQQQKLSVIFIPRGIKIQGSYYHVVRKCVYNPRREDIHPHAKQTPRERNEKIRVLRRREEGRESERHPEVRLLSRINHPNNRAVPPADSPKRAPTLCPTVCFARVYRVVAFSIVTEIFLLEKLEEKGGEKCDYSRHRRVSTVSSRKTGTPSERGGEAAASGTPGASRCGPREYRMHYSRTVEAGRR